MKFWKWFINLYMSKIKGIKITPNWGELAYYVGAMSAFFLGTVAFIAFFISIKWGLILTGVTVPFFILAHYGWYCLKVRCSTGSAIE